MPAKIVYPLAGGDVMDKQAVESAAMRLKGVEQILLHLSVSDYIIRSGDSELFVVLMEDIKNIRESIEEK